MRYLPIYLLLFTLATACKKNSPGGGGTTNPATTKKPCSILYNYEYRNGLWVRDGFMLLDLDHADNKDKSYMVVDVKRTSPDGFQFVIKKGPLPIDSLANNWPPEVRYVSFGYSNDMTVNASMRLQAQNGGPRFTYRYDSIYKFSSSIYMYNYLNNPMYAGSMAGKLPQGRIFAWGADASGNAIPRDIIFYFKESAFSNVIGVGNGGILLTDYQNGVNVASEFWKEVDAVLTLDASYYIHLYFDFDKWEYFFTEDWCPASYGAACIKGGVQYVNKKSMNTLMTWPKGWGNQ